MTGLTPSQRWAEKDRKKRRDGTNAIQIGDAAPVTRLRPGPTVIEAQIYSARTIECARSGPVLIFCTTKGKPEATMAKLRFLRESDAAGRVYVCDS